MSKRTRRTPEQMVADLQAEIERIKARAAEQKVRTDPSLRYISGALRSIDKATDATRDKATRGALDEARATLLACLALNGAAPPARGKVLVPRPRRSGSAPDGDAVLSYLRKHPGARSEEICGELGTEAVALRPVLHRLRDEEKVKVEGKARATRYSVGGDGEVGARTRA